MSSIDYIVPSVVAGLCLLVVAVVMWRSRERKPRWSLEPTVDVEDAPPPVDHQTLAQWHRAHGPAVAEWITAHERTLAQLGDAGLSIDLTDDSLTAERDAHIAPLGAAIAEHPSAVMRAELSAMQVAADATVHGVRRSEYATAERQHVTYVEYRDLWVGRLRQFSLDDPEIAELRRGLSQDTGVGRPPENGDLRLSS